MGGTTAVLGDRNARLFLGVTLTSGFGSTAMSLAASVWVLTLTGSASLAALCGLCVYLPSLAGPVLGALVDRLPRQRLLVTTSAAMAALLLTLLAVRGPAQTWLIFAVMLGYGVAFVLLDAGEAAVLQAAVPADRLGGVNSLRMSVQEGMKLVAPPAGAALFTLHGGSSVAVLSALALGVAAGCYAALRPGPLPVAAPGDGSLLRRTRVGMGFLRRHAPLRALVGTGSAAVAMSGLSNAAAYLVIVGDLGRAPEFAGVLAAAQGAGSVAGGLLCGRVLDRRGEPAAAWWGAALSALGLALQSVPSTPVVALARVLIGVGLPWTVIAAMTAVQRHTPAELIGRVAATANTVVFAPTALTIALGAGAVELLDHRLVLGVAAAGTLLAATPLLTRRHRRTATPCPTAPTPGAAELPDPATVSPRR
ncbi:MFS transporter [Catellatospora vulcania]|uniref:MFS transporter n=1 Tax=Catellatospora vulcania TaxID=1460450 RepID=UPI0018AF55D9|nr:MFS transporter [Catellatospora vulcania]